MHGRPDTPGPPPGILGDLEFLEYNWGSAYLIGREGGQYTAVRRDGQGGTLADPRRDGLMRRSGPTTTRPVPGPARDLP